MKFLKISQNSQKNEACNYIKKDTLALAFPYGFYEIFKNICYEEHLQTVASKQYLEAIYLEKVPLH